MRGPKKTVHQASGWNPIPDPEGRYSTGVIDFDRLLGGGLPRGSLALFAMDESVGLEDLDLLPSQRFSTSSISPGG